MRRRGGSSWRTGWAFVAAACVLLFAAAVAHHVFDLQLGRELSAGGVTLNLDDGEEVRTLLNASGTPSDGNYDSFDSPRGTDFSVPIRQKLAITQVMVTADATSAVTVEIGVGTSHVEDSASAPADAEVLTSFSLPAGSGLHVVPLSLTGIGYDKYPYARITGTGGSWPGPVTLTGVLR